MYQKQLDKSQNTPLVTKDEYNQFISDIEKSADKLQDELNIKGAKLMAELKALADESNAVLQQVAERNYNDNKLKRDKEIETAKQKAMQQIESEYESKHGVDTEETQQTKQAWSNLLKGL